MTVLTAPRQTIATAGKLINLIIIRLVPMLLDATDGDPQQARALAIETINEYAARNNSDLLAIAQIIACGLASLGNLSLSMAGDVPHDLILRLQAASNALDRSARMNRRLLAQAPPPPTGFCYQPGPEDAVFEAAAMAESRQHVTPTHAERARANQPGPAESSAPPASGPAAPSPSEATTPAPAATTPATQPPGKPARDLTEHEKALIRAKGMNRVAAEYSASIPHLPTVQPREASLRATALGSTASALIARTPSETRPEIRPRPAG